jgi:hypothetical protein
MKPQCNEQSDLLLNKRSIAMGWLLPLGLMLLSRMLFSQIQVVGLVWTIAFAWMGTACFVNAKRCQRTHCFYTAPLFFLLSVIALGITRGWPIVNQLSLDLLALVTVITTALLWLLSEKYAGRYQR